MKGRGIYILFDIVFMLLDEEFLGFIDMVYIYYLEFVVNFLVLFILEVLLYFLEIVFNQFYVQGIWIIIDDLDIGSGVVLLFINYDGLLDCVCFIWRDEGVGGFYKGFGVLLI